LIYRRKQGPALLIGLVIVAAVVLLMARLTRHSLVPVPSTKVAEAASPTTNSEAPLETTTQHPTTPEEHGYRASEQPAPGSTDQEVLEDLARKRGVPLNVLTQELATA
jgi:hypothetical protein